MTDSQGDGSSIDMVVADIEQRVLRRDLHPGERLREADLTGKYGVSRHTAKLALQALQGRRIVQHDRHRGATVRRIDRRGVIDVFSAREVIEIGAVVRICRTPSNLDGVRAAVDALRKTASGTDASTAAPPASRELLRTWAEHDLAFHEALVTAGGGPALQRAYEGITSELQLMFAIYQAVEMPLDVDEHANILNALESGDRRTAEAILTRHLGEALTYCLDALP